MTDYKLNNHGIAQKQSSIFPKIYESNQFPSSQQIINYWIINQKPSHSSFDSGLDKWCDSSHILNSPCFCNIKYDFPKHIDNNNRDFIRPTPTSKLIRDHKPTQNYGIKNYSNKIAKVPRKNVENILLPLLPSKPILNSRKKFSCRQDFVIPPTLLAIRSAVNRLYRIDDFEPELIGTGFFSEVFKVTHLQTKETMVLKVNKQHSNRCNVLREIQLMNSLSHPNILRFLGVCVNGGQLHALTEYINSGNLEQLILDTKIELPWKLRFNLAIDITKGVRYLHGKGIFHRDLTSKNCLIRKSAADGKFTAIVGDLGLAADVPKNTSSSSCCNTPLPIVGSPFWMAPECLKGKYYDEKADIFSFGIILCEMIARIEADPDILPRTVDFGVDFVSLNAMCPSTPFEFLQIAFRCCVVDPHKRIPSFTAILKLLRILINNFEDQRDRTFINSSRHNPHYNYLVSKNINSPTIDPGSKEYSLCRRRSLSEPELVKIESQQNYYQHHYHHRFFGHAKHTSNAMPVESSLKRYLNTLFSTPNYQNGHVHIGHSRQLMSETEEDEVFQLFTSPDYQLASHHTHIDEAFKFQNLFWRTRNDTTSTSRASRTNSMLDLLETSGFEDLNNHSVSSDHSNSDSDSGCSTETRYDTGSFIYAPLLSQPSTSTNRIPPQTSSLVPTSNLNSYHLPLPSTANNKAAQLDDIGNTYDVQSKLLDNTINITPCTSEDKGDSLFVRASSLLRDSLRRCLACKPSLNTPFHPIFDNTQIL